MCAVEAVGTPSQSDVQRKERSVTKISNLRENRKYQGKQIRLEEKGKGYEFNHGHDLKYLCGNNWKKSSDDQEGGQKWSYL